MINQAQEGREGGGVDLKRETLIWYANTSAKLNRGPLSSRYLELAAQDVFYATSSVLFWIMKARF